jgi:hypothetical protein
MICSIERHHIDLVVVSRIAAITHFEFPQVRFNPEDAFYFPTLVCELQVLARSENKHGALGAVFGTLNPDLDGSGKLTFADKLDEASKFWIGWAP